MGEFNDKVVLVTGGTSGIGGATVSLLAHDGATVIAVGRNERQGYEKMSELSKYRSKVCYFKADVSVSDDIKKIRDFIVEKYGRLDALFNNAGILLTDALEDINDDEWDRSYDVNVKATLHMCQTFMPMLQKSHGVILNNASINGLHTYIKGKKSYMYATSKAALIQLTRYLAKNYAPDVRVNALCPGITKTNLFTNRDFSRFDNTNLLGRMAEPEEIAKVAAFLLSEDSSFMTGSIVVADGGETIK